MGALEDDLDYAVKMERNRNFISHPLKNPEAGWDDIQCGACLRRGGVDMSFNRCDAGTTVHVAGCDCGFCKMGSTKV